MIGEHDARFDLVEVSVRQRIREMEERGGPDEEDWKAAAEFGQVLAEKGDVLLFGGKKGEAAGLFNGLAHAVTVLSFCPGGITIFGQHYEGGQQGRTEGESGDA